MSHDRTVRASIFRVFLIPKTPITKLKMLTTMQIPKWLTRRLLKKRPPPNEQVHLSVRSLAHSLAPSPSPLGKPTLGFFCKDRYCHLAENFTGPHQVIMRLYNLVCPSCLPFLKKLPIPLFECSFTCLPYKQALTNSNRRVRAFGVPSKWPRVV